MHHVFKRLFSGIGIFIILVSILSSCKKEKWLTDGGQIGFSTDTLKFDTVFTSVGSVTREFKIYNVNSKRIKVSEIKLKGGSASPFRMNIDGVATKSIQNVEIAPNDSIYVFVALTVDPTAGLLPFVVNDAVEVTLNGMTSELQLEAFGQDAHYITDSVLTSATWVNDKPYVIVHSALIDSNNTLVIQKGCRIYMHQDSKLYVNGTLNVYGTKKDSVIFQGDRLDRDYFGYKDYPGEWRGIHFLAANYSSHINYAVIKNGGLTDAAIYVQPQHFFDVNNPAVEIRNSRIENSLGYGILAFNAHILGNNCLIQSCGSQNLAILEGGKYEFNFCTFATYGGLGINHSQDPVAAILNYRDTSLTSYTGNNLNAVFNNCIIYGPLDDEIIFSKKTEWDYNVTMNNCIMKRKATITNATTNNCILNQDPQFTDYAKWDYHLETTSVAKGAGISIPGIIDDLDGNTRSATPTIGCYEIQ